MLMMVSFMACKKESTNQPKNTQEKIMGKWYLLTTVTNDFYAGTSHINTFTWNAGDYIDFRKDGKAYNYNSGGYDTSSYGITSDSKLWIDDASYLYDINILTETDLQVYRKDIFSPSEYTEATATARR